MEDMARNIDRPNRMRPVTREILWGELPDAIVDINSRVNYPSYPKFEPMYYRMADLASAIHRRRTATGQSLPDMPYERSLYTPYQDEQSRCRGIARPLWRLLVQRSHPEWLENPKEYYPSSYIGTFCVVYAISESRQRRGIVSHAVLSDELVMSTYQEATSTGVRGIGPLGREDLRLLLSDEHPELLEGKEAIGIEK